MANQPPGDHASIRPLLSGNYHALVPRAAIEGRIIHTRYVGVWAFISHSPMGRTQDGCTTRSVAEAIGVDETFVEAAFDHFKEVGCIVHDGSAWVISDMAFRLYEEGITEVETIRQAVIAESRRSYETERALPLAERARRQVFLYVIRSANGLYKIGVSQDVAQRLKTLRSMSPQILKLEWKAEGSYAIEEALHEKFRKYRAHGEWFDFGRLSGPVTHIRREALRLGAVEVSA